MDLIERLTTRSSRSLARMSQSAARVGSRPRHPIDPLND
jgi:hypothetical protein